MRFFSLWSVFTRLSKHRIKSGVLQLTLGISLVISILCASIIMLVYYNKLAFLDQDINNRLRNNATSGIQYIMAKHTGLVFNKSETIDLFGEETDSVNITRRPWGIFELYTAHARQGNHQCIKTALIASAPSEVGKAALYSPDNNAPLYLVGKTTITGTVYTSERKFSTGYIDGRGYEKDKLVHGDVKKSETSMLSLDTVLLHEIKLLLNLQSGLYDLKTLDRLPFDTLFSFEQQQANYYFSNQSIDVEGSLGGNIIIQSAMKVRITAAAKLTDVIIIAPDIDIDKGFNGNIQCFATRTITVGAESTLHYPSALVLLDGLSDSTIVIHHDARVEGAVIIKGFDQSIGSRGVFKIENKGVLHGMAYINGAADIQGTLLGHITARSFQARVGDGAVYGNHLIDGEIDGTRRSVHMPATMLWANTKQLVIAKWIE